MDYSRIVFATQDQMEKNNEHKPLVVTNCGCYTQHNKSSAFNTTRLYNGWLLLYLHKGRIRLPNNQIIESGSVLIFPPSQSISYQFLDDETNERYYIYFKGTHALTYMKQFLLDQSPGIYQIGESKTLISYFFDIMNDFKIHNFDSDIFRTTLLLRLLNHIHKKLPIVLKNTEENSSLHLIVEYMEKNYCEQLSLEDYAKLANISIPVLMRNFKKHFKTTPHAYLNNIRLTQAQNLILSTDLSITEIALQVGFLDPLYFCKFFKSQTNYSPSSYRKQFTPVE